MMDVRREALSFRGRTRVDERERRVGGKGSKGIGGWSLPAVQENEERVATGVLVVRRRDWCFVDRFARLRKFITWNVRNGCIDFEADVSIACENILQATLHRIGRS